VKDFFGARGLCSRFVAYLGLALCLFSATGYRPLFAESVQSINILFIASAEEGNHHVDSILIGLKSGLLESGVNPAIFMESLDETRFSSSEAVRRLVAQHIEQRFASVRFDIILAQGSEAADFAARYRRERGMRVPILACDILQEDAATRFAGEPSFYGRTLVNTMPYIIRFSIDLFPRLKKVVLVVQPNRVGTYTGLVAATKSEYPSLSIAVLRSDDSAGIAEAFSASRADTFGILRTLEISTPDGKVASNQGMAKYLISKYEVPLFTVVEELLGSGFLGGYIIDNEGTGREAASMVIDILYDAVKPVPWGTSSVPPPLKLDHRILKRFSIPMQRIPEGAHILFAPPSFWVRYQIELEIVGLLLVLIILALVSYIVVRRHDRMMLRRSNETLERTVAERTAELKVANVELETTNGNLVASLRRIESMQEHLIAETKEVVMGRLALGLAHEINNPLGAIRSADAAVLKVLTESPEGLVARVLAFDERQKGLFSRFIGRAMRLPQDLEPLATARKDDLRELLRSLRVENEIALSDEIEDADLAELGPEELRELCAAENKPVLDALFYCSVLAKSAVTSEIAATKIARTIEAIRSYAREHEQGRKKGLIDLRSTIDQALMFFREAERQGVAIGRDYSDAELTVEADESALVRLWTNIMQNAFQAMGGKGALSLRVAASDGFAIVEITDTRPLIPEELRGAIFEPFASTGAGIVLGLGLSICKRIVEGYDGAIEYDCSSGQSLFRIRLPLAGSRR
jgi:signal transduction histidine kinase